MARYTSPKTDSSRGARTRSAEAAPDAAGASNDADAPEAPARGRSGGGRRGLPRWLRVLIVAVVVVAVAAAALFGAYSWNRWYRYDDAADFQGQWFPVGSTSAIQIGPDTIAFDAETAYSYTLDTHEKTVSYQLGQLEGKGHYWFSDDRNALVIWDGTEFDATSTALDDLGRMFMGLNAAVDGNALSLPEGEGIIAFTRTVDPAVVVAKERAEREAREAQEAEQQAAAEGEQAAAEGEGDADAEDAGAGAAGDGHGSDEAASADNADNADDSDDAADAASGADASGDAASGDDASGAAGADDAAADAKKGAKEPQDFANESMGIL